MISNHKLPHLVRSTVLKLLHSHQHGAGVVCSVDQKIITKEFCHVDSLAKIHLCTKIMLLSRLLEAISYIVYIVFEPQPTSI